MPIQKLTSKFVEHVAAPKSGRLELWDATLPGFGLRVTPKKRSWFLMYRAHGRQRRLTLGHFPAMTLAKAHEKAEEALRHVDRQADPKIEAARAAYATQRLPGRLLKAVIEEHAKDRLKGLRTGKEINQGIERGLLAQWGDVPIEEITKADINEILRGIKNTSTPVAARNMRAFLNPFFVWAVDQGYIAQNPVAGIPPPAKAKDRDRVLDDDEIKTIWAHAVALGYPYGDFIRVLLLTAQRLSEVAGMRWDEINLATGLWTLPSTRTKAARLQEVPLAPAVIRIIEAAPKKGPFVFSTRDERPISGFSKWKAEFDAKVGVANFRHHDLRRTAATSMARLNVPEHVLSRILNHSTGSARGVTGIYNRHAYTVEKRHALECWANYLEGMISGRPSNVHELAAAS